MDNAAGRSYLKPLAYCRNLIGSTEEILDGVTIIGESAFVDRRSLERILLEDEEYEAPLFELLTIDS